MIQPPNNEPPATPVPVLPMIQMIDDYKPGSLYPIAGFSMCARRAHVLTSESLESAR